jgi:shikimate kinase
MRNRADREGRGRNLCLIGFMGSGKSAVGRALTEKLGWACLETDELVAAEFGMPITQIFQRRGEARFREAESAILRELPATEQALIVTGGGIVLRAENVKRLRALGMVVWLKADLAILQKRLAGAQERPLLQTPDPAAAIAELLAQRVKFYEAAADLAVDSSHLEPAAVASTILDELQITG